VYLIQNYCYGDFVICWCGCLLCIYCLLCVWFFVCSCTYILFNVKWYCFV